MDADIQLEDCGTIVKFRMLTRAAVNWMVDNVHYESWQLKGPTVLCIERRYAKVIAGVAQEAGLTVVA